MAFSRSLIAGVAAITLAVASATASAAEVKREILKTFFETGDVPTEQQFGTLIDSFINYTDDGLTINGIVVNSGGQAKLLPDNDVITLGSLFTAPGPGGYPAMPPEFEGKSGYLGLRLTKDGNTYLGYLQLSMDNSAVVSPPGIHVDYFAFENSGGSIQVQPVPEPASLCVLGLGAIALLRRRR